MTDIIIGNYCSLARGIAERPLNHPYKRFTTSSITYDNAFPIFSAKEEKNIITCANSFCRKPFHVEHDVWIGADALIGPGVTIHTGAIVATRSNVTKDVPPYHIVGGNPAKIIKMRFPENEVEALLSSRWYEYDISTLPIRTDVSIPEFLDTFHEAKEKGKIQTFPQPRPFLSVLDELGIPFE